jgi:GR25 family glycosyltransferase involved in LPS biosynthesis
MWEFVDRAYIVTLRDATHRHGRMHAALRAAGLADKTKVYKAARHPTHGGRGCWESHVAMMDMAREDGCKVALIMEDDVQFTPDFAQYLPLVQAFVDTVPADQWDFLMLGIFPHRTKAASDLPPQLQPHFQRVLCGAQTHAYLANANVIQEGIQPRTMTNVDQSIDMRLFCGARTGKELFLPPKTEGSLCAQGPGMRMYKAYALKPQIALQAYDGTSSAAKLQNVTLRLAANSKVMRASQNVSMRMNTLSFVYVVAGTMVLVIALMMAALIVGCKP